MNILSNLNLHKNELQNARVQNLAAEPTNAVIGQMYFDTSRDTLREYTSEGWKDVGSEGHKYEFATGETDGTIKVTEDDGDPQEIAVAGLKTAAFTDTETEIDDEEPSENVPTSAAVKSYVDGKIEGLAGGMKYKGTVGTGGTVTALPEDAAVGDTYKVITDGTYAGQAAKLGDMFIKIESGWSYIPSGDDGGMKSVVVENPGLSAAAGQPVNWIIQHSLGTIQAVQIVEKATGEHVIMDVIHESNGRTKISFIPPTGRADAGTYKAILIS